MNQIPLTVNDFTSDQEVRWCPGCGDYAILKAVRKTLADVGKAPHEVVFVSGIGCAARFPYYVSTYGFHTIHGRAPAIATGVKLSNPELDVWVIGGDGDFLSIGGNHTLHALRRNVDLNLLLFNNAIYGLTKGQYSPTSHVGTRSPSSPWGSIDRPINAAQFALGAGATFFARAIDTMQNHLPGVLARAHGHKGASLVEIFQNCIVFNDGVFSSFAEKPVQKDATIELNHGEPLVFGKDGEKGLRFDRERLEFDVVAIENDADRETITRHDETNLLQAMALARLSPPTAPMPIGVYYVEAAPVYDEEVEAKLPCAPMSLDELKGHMGIA